MKGNEASNQDGTRKSLNYGLEDTNLALVSEWYHLLQRSFGF